MLTPSQLSLSLLASILLLHLSADIPPKANTKAIVIDTTGSFPIPLLASIIKSRIVSNQDARSRREATTGNYEVGGGEKIDHLEVDRDVQSCLEMVAISRVFDLEGLWEVLGEVGRDSCSGDEATVSDLAGADQAEEVAEEGHEEDRPRDEGTELVIIDSMGHIINELFSRKEKGDCTSPQPLFPPKLHRANETSTHPPYNSLPNNPHPVTHLQHPHPPPQRHNLHKNILL